MSDGGRSQEGHVKRLKEGLECVLKSAKRQAILMALISTKSRKQKGEE